MSWRPVFSLACGASRRPWLLAALFFAASLALVQAQIALADPAIEPPTAEKVLHVVDAAGQPVERFDVDVVLQRFSSQEWIAGRDGQLPVDKLSKRIGKADEAALIVRAEGFASEMKSLPPTRSGKARGRAR